MHRVAVEREDKSGAPPPDATLALRSVPELLSQLLSSSDYNNQLVKMDDLFSAFTAKPPKAGAASASTPTPKKRQASPAPPAQESESAKKAKTAQPIPQPSTSFTSAPPPVQATAADEFETEAKTEVPGSVGLGGGTAEGLVLSHAVRHQVALPPNYPYVPIASHVPPEEPARVYPFELDPFQKVSVASIQRNESVLVSAHTSAGKTVVAEYAIAQCLKRGQRVVYTSPIKVSLAVCHAKLASADR